MIEIIAVPIRLAALIKNSGSGIANLAIICFAVVRLDTHMFGIDSAEMNASAYLQRFADQDGLSIFVADLHIRNPHLWPILAHLRLPVAELRRPAATIARKILVRFRRWDIKPLGIFLHHPLRIENRCDAAN